MAPIVSLPIALSLALTGREIIIDALYQLWDSAFTEDAQFELGGRNAEDLKAIHSDIYDGTISRLDTTHHISNISVNVTDGEREALLSAFFPAYHFRGGTEKELDSPEYTVGSQYYLELVKNDVDGMWKTKLFRVKSIWSEGDRSVMGH
ncbi:SnoaL 4 domain containing protein [Pyrenophora tritici-repentis]|nr:hypothetical protein L13192_07999 [Pyrenophora tritici-repentis]KAI2476000.1 SnoaL 4 domain containing protein [Pyrenophora tritici-repentis]